MNIIYSHKFNYYAIILNYRLDIINLYITYNIILHTKSGTYNNFKNICCAHNTQNGKHISSGRVLFYLYTLEQYDFDSDA